MPGLAPGTRLGQALLTVCIVIPATFYCREDSVVGDLYRVGISGSYGGMNLGDEAILQSMIAQLRAELPVEITVFTRDAEDTHRRHGVERVIAARSLSREEILPDIERLDLFILGGGGILYDADVRTYLREAILAEDAGVPVMLYAIGAGPLEEPATQAAVRDCLNRAEVITVRERHALKVLEEAGVEREIVLTADPALVLTAEPLPEGALAQEGMEGERPLVGMSVREPGAAAPDIDQDMYHALLANAADFVVDRYGADIVFVPMERSVRDTQHSHAVIAQMLRAQHANVLKGAYTSGQVLTLMSHFRFALGMRLHFLLFAALQGVPFVALPYASKVTGFLEDLELVVPPFQLINPGRLIAYLDQCWDNREALRTSIAAVLPALKERARETNRLAVELLKKRQPRQAPQ